MKKAHFSRGKYCPDHIRKNKPAVFIRFADLFERPHEIGLDRLVPREGAIDFLAESASKYRVTVVSPAIAQRFGAVMVWDEIREALTRRFDGDAARARSILVHLGLQATPDTDNPQFAQPDEDDVWYVYAQD